MAVQDFTLSKEYLQSLFDYRDGELYWKISKQKIIKGSKAGTLHHSGYVYLRINGKHYASHRLIFMMFNGYLPEFIDHIDRNKSNNKIENLRATTKQQNSFNANLSKANSSGIKGVSWHKKDKKWQVYLSVNKKLKNFGSYYDLNLAKFVAETMRYKYHKEFSSK